MFRHAYIFRRVFAGLVAGVVMLSGASQTFADTTLDRIRENGSVRIGFANEPPYGYATPDGAITGEAPEVAKAIFRKMGIERVEGVMTEFGSLIPGLQAGRFDVIAAGMFITPSRCEQIRFSEPSYGIGQAFLVQEGNPENIRDYESVAENPSLKLAVMSGAVEAGYARDVGVASEQLLMLPDQVSLVRAVQAGRADAAALTALSIANMAEKNEGVESTAPFGMVADQSVVGHGGFGFRMADEELYEAFNAELKAFVGSPEHVELVTPFGFGEGFLPTKTSAEICTGG